MPEITRRSSTRRAPGWFFGKCGSIAAHASSDNQNNERDIPNSLLPQRRPPESMCTQIFQEADWVWTLIFGVVARRGIVCQLPAEGIGE